MKIEARTQKLLLVIISALIGVAIGFKARRYFPMRFEYGLIVFDATEDNSTFQEMLYAKKVPRPDFMSGRPDGPQSIVIERGNMPQGTQYKLLYGVDCWRWDSGAVNTIILATTAGKDSILICPYTSWQDVAAVLYDHPYIHLGNSKQTESIECYELAMNDVPSALEYVKDITVAQLAQESKPKYLK